MLLRSLIRGLAFLALILVPACVASAQCPGGRCVTPQGYGYAYSPPTSPTMYQLADASGQRWTHADPVYLAAFVTDRNKGIGHGVPTQATPQYQSGDPYGFGAWLNGVRAQRGLGPVGLDGQLTRDAATNSSIGFGHAYMGSARRQNAGQGSAGTVWSMWTASPLHAAALFDPSITAYGIAYVAGNWTFSAR